MSKNTILFVSVLIHLEHMQQLTADLHDNLIPLNQVSNEHHLKLGPQENVESKHINYTYSTIWYTQHDIRFLVKIISNEGHLQMREANISIMYLLQQSSIRHSSSITNLLL
jgi:hypothetical protein